MAESKIRFPKNFLWGASTAAHQVEGGNHNQWSIWELEHARAWAMQSEYQLGELEKWPLIKQDAKDPNNYVSGRAIDHYHRYESDFDLLEELNMNAFRFSIEWSRVEPTEGAWNIEAIEHYKRYVRSLKERKIEPVLTLFHFTLPVWFAEKGGFEYRRNVKYFVRFVEKVLTELGNDIRLIITINEPEVYASQSYYQGHWPPARQSKRLTHRVLKNLAYAHNQTARMTHKLHPRYKLSIAKNSSYTYAGDNALLSRKTADAMQYFSDDYFLKKVIDQCDFLGVNYYFSNRVYGYRVHNPEEHVSDMGWDMQPANLEFVVERLWEKYKKPIIITENGLADADDELRKWWLQHTLLALQRALQSGVRIQGYLHWSLLDNVEWAYGRWPRFGLAEVDYISMKRTLRPSAHWFGQMIAKLRKGSQ
ncbi:beta-glucosidase [Candidatus Saccharibacteria bacterium RAAC3_TM7_1]|nr:beta-glucosidase [Candidatus Saccharibacteria bacterium RAAC3_TM7_1]HCZ28386.1 glycoside hydrolase family 1 protein [Candidatus Saccharibacteria bacterium]